LDRKKRNGKRGRPRKAAAKANKPNGKLHHEEADQDGGGLQARIIALLARDPSKQFPAKEIAEKLGASPRGVNLSLGQLRKAGKIDSVDGKFQIDLLA
jgi:hypothetical protein